MHHIPHLNSFRDWVRQFFYGICIGIADLMPGISGGTMALILGIYEDVIAAVKTIGSKDALSLFTLKFKHFSKAVSWDFLLALMLGMGFTFVLLTQALQKILNDPLYHGYFYALFLGMMLGSVAICCKRVKTWKTIYLSTFIFGAIITYFLTGLRVEPKAENPRFNVYVPAAKLEDISGKHLSNYDIHNEVLLDVSKSNLAAMLSKGDVAYQTPVVEQETQTKGHVGDFVSENDAGLLNPWLIMCGTIAITAMMMPGITGSYVLNVLGAYSIVIGALADFTRGGDFDAFVILMNIGLGVLIGAILFSRVVDMLLTKYHDGTMIMLLGFMIGSLQSVWPFFTFEYLVNPLSIKKGPELNILEPYLPSLSNPEVYYFLAVAIGGIISIYLLDAFVKRRTKRTGQTNRT